MSNLLHHPPPIEILSYLPLVFDSMPFQNRTPESLVQRSDSKNPATTCRGITTAGKKCRHSLASPKSPSAAARRSSGTGVNGVVAVVQDDTSGPASAAFFCWQHKDQAEKIVHDNEAIPGHGVSRLVPVQERTSIDSLVARLGVMGINKEQGSKPRQRQKHRVDTDPRRQSWTRIPVELLPEPAETVQTRRRHERNDRSQPPTQRRKQKKPSFWESLCCMTNHEDDEYMEIVRHRQRTRDSSRPEMAAWNLPPPLDQQNRRPQSPPSHRTDTAQANRNNQSQSHADLSSRGPISQGPHTPQRRPLAETPPRPMNRHTVLTESPTRNLLSWIPAHLSPATTSALLTELSKPISPHDQEGYIYIFWLTDSDLAPSDDTATSLLSSPRQQRSRRLSDVMSEYSYASESHGRQKRTTMLKIGRANNVHRRMTEWTRQCGYNLSLVRWYPYIPSSPLPSPCRTSNLHPDFSRPATKGRVSDQVRKVPHASRVERLIHLELAEQRVKRQCAACGKEHREWFEVDATEAGVKAVDEVIKRWVAWAERAEVGA